MSASPDQTLLSATGLGCRRGARQLFRALSLNLAAGEALVLTGTNGSGKSTLLRILAGLAAADEGAIQTQRGEEFPEAVHYCGHRDGLREALTAEENLAYLACLLGGAPARTGEALERLGAGRLARLPVRVLSAGQRRRVSLAPLLVAPRPLWLLDEPLTALDTEGQGVVTGLIGDHLRAGGGAIVATHQPLGIAAREIRLGRM